MQTNMPHVTKYSDDIESVNSAEGCKNLLDVLQALLMWGINSNYNSINHSLYGHYTGQPALAGTSSYELKDFAGEKV